MMQKTDDFYLSGSGDNSNNNQLDSHTIGGHFQYESEVQFENQYQCILNCENNKIYNKPGYCPDCNMKLVSVGESHHHH